MEKIVIQPSSTLKGKPVIPGDKSISHRSLLFGALAEGTSEIRDILESGDVQSTQRCLAQMGVRIEKRGEFTIVHGTGIQGLKKPAEILDCGNSGTTMRLMMGILSSIEGFETALTGDSSLVKRPMKRVSEPLSKMGAHIELTGGNLAPMKIHGKRLKGIEYALPVASAQIKSAIMLAALSAQGDTVITGEIKSRDHSERMLAYYGARLEVTDDKIRVHGGQKLEARKINVPGDPSTAAFWIGAACLVPGAFIEMENVSLNPTRTGFIEAMKRMGAQITTEITSQQPEPVGRIQVKGGTLRGTHVTAEEVPSLIDELPLLAVVASQARGETLVEGAEELRVKESDRIEAVVQGLRSMGVQIEGRPDGFKIAGPQKLKGAVIESHHDHRIAMAFSIAGLIADGPTTILNPDCVSISYPGFYSTLQELTKR